MASKLILARAALFKPLITLHSEQLSVNLFLFQKLFLFSSVRTPNQFRMAGSREKSLESNPVLHSHVPTMPTARISSLTLLITAQKNLAQLRNLRQFIKFER